ncbi:MAG: hypothetical protein U0T81_10260 [Saprospiraceae bacterium]
MRSQKLRKKLSMPGDFASCEKKLGNERFVASAPPDLVEKNEKNG